jgi:Rieske 2Fe-2S family protein
VGGEGIVLIRDEEQRVRGFFNTCRHRGHELLADGECRTRAKIACPYHSWTYNLDGSLRRATRFSDIPGFDPADFPLLPCAVREWNGWIFVNMSGNAGGVEEWLGNLGDYLDNWHTARLTAEASHEYIVEANWKLIIENYLECYHCPSIHPQLCRVSPPDSARAVAHSGIWIGGPMDLRERAQTMSLDGVSKGTRMPGLTDEQARRVYYFAVFPSILISPHPDYVMTHRLDPISPTKTRVECAWLFPPEAKNNPSFEPSYAQTFWDITNKQDFSACEAVQRGIAGRGFIPGPFDDRESAVYALQALLAQAYISGKIQQPREIGLPSTSRQGGHARRMVSSRS